MDFFSQLAISGILVGVIYGLIALGFILIYKCSSVFNFAVGEFVVLGAFIFYAIIVQANMPIWVGFVGTFISAVIIALAMERFALRPMIGKPIISVIVMTIALAIFLTGIMTLIWGGKGHSYPPFIPSTSIHLGAVVIPQYYIYTLIIAVVILLAFFYFFRYTKWGLAMRATSESHEVAQSMGINVRVVFVIAWLVALFTCSVGGILLGSMHGLSVGYTAIGLKVFPAVLIGGLESVGGALAGGVILGFLENLTVGYLGPILGPGIKDIIAYVIILLVLLVRPYGLFGWRKIERI